MSGITGSKLNIRGSGLVAKLGTDGQILTSTGAGTQAAFEDAAAGISWQAVETGSTMTAVAGNGYPIDTSSNACTITLPSSASLGDQIIFTDYARNWGTNGIVIDSNGLNYQGDDDTYDVEYGTDGTALHIVYSGSTNGWIPTLDKAVDDVPSPPSNDEGIFAFGTISGMSDITNLVSNAGVVQSDVSGVGTGRYSLTATEYGGDKGIIGFGHDGVSTYYSITNLVSNAGVVASDQAATTGTARDYPAACGYGGDKGIFGYGDTGSVVTLTNLVSNTGVVASDGAGAGTARDGLAACEYGGDKGIFGFGYDGSVTNVTNLVSNTGVVASDQAATTGTARNILVACSFGDDKGIFGLGNAGGNTGVTNLVSNTGVVASDVSAVATARHCPAACEYGGDKGIFGFGKITGVSDITNLISNTGVVQSDGSGVGSARRNLAACSFN